LIDGIKELVEEEVFRKLEFHPQYHVYTVTYESKMCDTPTTWVTFEVVDTDRRLSDLLLKRISPWRCDGMPSACADPGKGNFLSRGENFPTKECLQTEFEEVFIKPLRATMSDIFSSPTPEPPQRLSSPTVHNPRP
jgi:hypothetical protein